jgi:MFS family permease
VLTAALFISGAVYLLFPFSQSMVTLAALSFCLGLGLGGGQPVVMSLLHTHAPPGRMGEAAGVRMSLVQSMSVAVPLLFGAVGSTLGLAPVFWSVGIAADRWRLSVAPRGPMTRMRSVRRVPALTYSLCRCA